jgi:hypothetical protein
MANETELGRLVVRLVGDGSSYQKMIESAVSSTRQAAERIEQSVDRFGTATVATGNLVAAGVEKIVEKFKELGSEALHAFEKHELSEVKLKAVIQARNGAVEESIKEYEKFADSISAVTTHGKVEVEQLLQMAESYGLTGKAAEIATKQAIGLSDTMPISAEGAVRLTSRLQQGSTEMLGRFVPGLDKVTTALGQVTLANDRFNRAFEVSKSLTTTISGTFASLEKAVHGLYAEMGELVADAIKPFVEGLANVVKWFRSWDPLLRKVTVGVVALTAAVASFDVALELLSGSAALASLKAIGSAVLAINPEILALAAAVAAVGTVVTYQFGGITKTLEAIADALKPIWVGIKELGAIAKQVAGLLIDSLGAALKYIWTLAKEVWSIFGIDLVAAIRTFVTWVKAAASAVLNFAIRVEYTIQRMRDWIKGIKGVKETFEQFKARRLKELWGVDEAADGLNNKVLPPLKAIDKILHPREAVELFSVEAFDRINEQLNGIARNAANVAAGGAPIFAHPVPLAGPVGGAAAAGGGLIGRAGGGGGFLGGGGGGAGGPMFFGPRGPKNADLNRLNQQQEFNGLVDSALQQMNQDPRFAHLTKAKKLEIAKNSAGREIRRRYPPKAGDEMNEPHKGSIRNFPESAPDFRMAPKLPTFDNGDVRKKGGLILPPAKPLRDADIAPNGRDAKPFNTTSAENAQLSQIASYLAQLVDQGQKKKTVEIKPLGLS